jgi:hypothetical protein
MTNTHLFAFICYVFLGAFLIRLLAGPVADFLIR